MIIPIKTLWTRLDGWQVPEGELKPTDLRMTFSGAFGIPIPNPFGGDHRAEYNKTVTVEGFSIIVYFAEWENGQIFLHMSITDVPEGGLVTAWPLAAILIALAAATGLVLLIILLSKIEAVLNLPLMWLILGGIGILLLPKLGRSIKSIKGVAPA